ncbi:ammonia transporter [Gardnerella vaginalis]|uniref:ammonium transporter n=1 Tax=Gardnerella vaginalis TaxID=2702 RepID=UPI000E31D5A2|nr:ammonium transporter [Gardnerella vaginalis]RFD76602.1 ammonia transporter [Gardnerella vaginalis]
MTAMDPQWALLAAALVFVITPGIALFYGGRERATSMVNMMMLSAGAIAVTTIVWTLWGWSMAFAGKDMIGGVVGDPVSGLLLRDSMVADHGIFTSMDANTGLSGGGIPAAFRLACAVVAVALITGALAGRVKYAIWLIFVAVWVTLVFAPLAHMVCGGGLLSPNGAISQALGIQVHDFAGGSLLHLTAAVSALAIVLIIGGHAHFPLKRFVLHTKSSAVQDKSSNSSNNSEHKGNLVRALWADVARFSKLETNMGSSSSKAEDSSDSVEAVSDVADNSVNVLKRHPHNVPFVVLGIFIIWFGWLGLMIGSSVGLPGVAGYAWVSSTITASASMLAWGVTERLRSGCFTAVGAASGIMAGLAASAAAADVIAPLWAMVLGVIVGVATCLATHSKTFARYDGALHVVSVNGIAALIGIFAVGLFADSSGLFCVGDWHQLIAQICLLVITVLYSGAVTALVAFGLEKLFGWRISEAKERKGVDLADQGERAYDFSSIAQARAGAVVEVADSEEGKTQVAVLTPVAISVDESVVDADGDSVDSDSDSAVAGDNSAHSDDNVSAQSQDEVELGEEKIETEKDGEESEDSEEADSSSVENKSDKSRSNSKKSQKKQ